MALFRPQIFPFPGGRWLLALALGCGVFLLGAASTEAKPKPSPSPSATPRALTPDNIGADPGKPGDSLPDPVAKVNGQAISKADLIQVTESLLANTGHPLKDLGPADQEVAFHSVLDQIITDRLVSEQARSEKVDEVTVLQAYSNLEKQYGTEAFEAQIKKSGQTPEKIRVNIRNQLAQQQWLEKQIANDTRVTPQEIEKFYKDNPPSKFDVPAMVQASHILVAVRRDAPPEDALDAENKINALNDRLKKGAKFEDLAREASDDKKTGQDGGDLGYFMKDRVLPEIGDTAFKLKVGETSAPVRSDFGYHLIKVTNIKPAHNAPLDEVRGQIESYLMQQKRAAAVAKVVQNLKEHAKIESFLS